MHDLFYYLKTEINAQEVLTDATTKQFVPKQMDHTILLANTYLLRNAAWTELIYSFFQIYRI